MYNQKKKMYYGIGSKFKYSTFDFQYNFEITGTENNCWVVTSDRYTRLRVPKDIFDMLTRYRKFDGQKYPPMIFLLKGQKGANDGNKI